MPIRRGERGTARENMFSMSRRALVEFKLSVGVFFFSRFSLYLAFAYFMTDEKCGPAG